MKNTFFIITICCFSIGYAQFGEQQIISSEASGARGVHAADLDGDGDLDVFAAAESDDKVAWYKNVDGLGSFGSENIITLDLHAAADVYGADLDGDGDMDILATSKGHIQQEGKVVWYENLDGQGNFSQEQIISELTLGAVSVYAIDLDGDTDLDVLSASFNDNKVAWYENIDGLGNFGAQQIITNSASSTRDVYAADLDGDDDMDVLTVSTATDEVLWFENLDGLGIFGAEQIINSNANGVISVYATDIDGDLDLDVISASFGDEKVAWYENMDGLGNFGSEQIITETLNSTVDIYAADLDNDGDMDVLSASANEDRVVWFENVDGQGTFGLEQIITIETDWARSVHAADIDGDGDLDVLSTSKVDNKVAWYENLTPLSVEEFSNESISLIPNPSSTILTINNKTSTQIDFIKIYDVLGRLILLKKEQFNTIDVSQFNNGLLFVQLETEFGVITKKIVKK